MARIPTLIPETVSDWYGSVRSGRWFDIVWKLSVLIATVVLIVLLVSAGGAWTILAFILGYAALRDQIHAVWEDIWNRDFLEVDA
jgi:hypothetical protein